MFIVKGNAMEDVKLEEVSFELSNRCYGRCIHCSSESTPDAETDGELSLEKWLDLVVQSSNLGAEVISLSGGDPLVYPDWQRVVSCIVDYGMGILFYTSGIKKAEQITRTGDEPSAFDEVVLVEGIGNEDLFFLKREFSQTWGKIIFSLEGSDAVVHDKVVGVAGSFNNTLESIAFAKEIGLEVELHFTPMACNWYQIESFLALAKMLKIDKVSFLRLVPQGRARDNVSDTMLSPEEFAIVQKTLYEWEGKPDFRIGCPLSFGHLFGYIDQRPRCHAGLDVMLIRPNGDVHSCAGWKECKRLVAGNAKDESLRWIWEHSLVMKTLRKFHEEDAAAGECTKCPWKYCCSGGCPAQRVIYNLEHTGAGSPWAQLTGGVDPMCPRFTGVLGSVSIRNARKGAGFAREQDAHGNVIS